MTYGEYKHGKKRDNIIIDAINCTPKTAKEEFALVRNLWGKNDGIQVHTVIQSFDSGVTMEEANKIGIETAQRLFPGHQVVVYTHCDGKGGKVHNHIMANAVNIENGRKFDNHGLIYKAREVSDEICKERGLTVIPYDNPTRKEQELKLQGITPWKDELRKILDEAKETSKNLDEFKARLKNEGIEINERNSRKEGGKALTYIVTRTDWGLNGRKIRGRTLGDDYTYAKIVQCIKKPKMTQSEEVTPSSTSTPKPMQDTPHNAFKWHKRKSIKDKYNQDLADVLNYCGPVEIKTDFVFGDDGKPISIDTPYKDPIYADSNLKQNLTAIKMIANNDFAGAAKSLPPDTMMRYVVNFYGTNTEAIIKAAESITNYNDESSDFTAKLLQNTLKTTEYKIASEKEKGVWSAIRPKMTNTWKGNAGSKVNGTIGRVSRVISGQMRRSFGVGSSNTHTTSNSSKQSGGGGILSQLSKILTGGKYARLDVPRIKQQWDDDWAWLSEADRAERRANLDHIDHY